mgnify:CR=1 FL=1
MMTKPDRPSPSDPRQHPTNRRALGAVLALAALVLVVGGIAAYSALNAPRPAAPSTNPLGAGNSSSTSLAAGLDAAAKHQRDGKFAEAAAVLAKLTEIDAADQTVRLAYAQALMGLKKHGEAYQQYEAALSLLPPGTTQRIASGGDEHAADLHFEAGTCASMVGGDKMADRAIEHYSMAQTAAPREPRYPLYLAMVQLKKGDRESQEAAVASLLRAAKLNPELGEAWGTLAEIALRNDQLGLASQHLEKARTLQPDVVRWRLVEARILNRRGDAEQAATALTALPPEQRRQPAVLAVLGESYGLLKRPLDAAAMYAEGFNAPGTEAPNAELAYQSALWFERGGNAAEARRMASAAAALGHVDARLLAGTTEK